MTPSTKLAFPAKSHPGKAGRKPAYLPLHLKKFRATDEEWQEFMYYLTGDAAQDFMNILIALRHSTIIRRNSQKEIK